MTIPGLAARQIGESVVVALGEVWWPLPVVGEGCPCEVTDGRKRLPTAEERFNESLRRDYRPRLR